MLWLVERFGADRMLRARVVLPSGEFFPDPYDPDKADARRCMDRACEYLGVDPKSVELEVLDDHLMPGAAGLYEMRRRS